jgi:hypothetical protein
MLARSGHADASPMAAPGRNPVRRSLFSHALYIGWTRRASYARTRTSVLGIRLWNRMSAAESAARGDRLTFGQWPRRSICVRYTASPSSPLCLSHPPASTGCRSITPPEFVVARRKCREDCPELTGQAPLQYNPVLDFADHHHAVVRVQGDSAELHLGLRSGQKRLVSSWLYLRASRCECQVGYMIIDTIKTSRLDLQRCVHRHVNKTSTVTISSLRSTTMREDNPISQERRDDTK